MQGGLSCKNTKFPWSITFSSLSLQGMENAWICFGSIPPLSHTSTKSKTKFLPPCWKGIRSFCIMHSNAETQPVLPEVGNHKQEASALHESGRGETRALFEFSTKLTRPQLLPKSTGGIQLKQHTSAQCSDPT